MVTTTTEMEHNQERARNVSQRSLQNNARAWKKNDQQVALLDKNTADLQKIHKLSMSQLKRESCAVRSRLQRYEQLDTRRPASAPAQATSTSDNVILPQIEGGKATSEVAPYSGRRSAPADTGSCGYTFSQMRLSPFYVSRCPNSSDSLLSWTGCLSADFTQEHKTIQRYVERAVANKKTAYKASFPQIRQRPTGDSTSAVNLQNNLTDKNNRKRQAGTTYVR